MELLERAVRFGDVGPGRLLHHGRVLHLLIVGAERLADRLDDPFVDVVAAGGVPHMPVAVRAAFERYPRYGEELRLHGEPVAVGETSYTARYALRDADGAPLAAASVVHVTVDDAGTPQPVADDVRRRVGDEDGDSFPGVDHDLAADDADVGDAPFGHEFTVRAADVEAVGQAYFEEYFREFERALEAHLEARGPSLGERADDGVPFVPTGLAVGFDRPVQFEDRVAVEGRLAGDGDDVTGHYRLRGERRTRLAGVVAYGRADPEDGTLTALPPGALDGLRGG